MASELEDFLVARISEFDPTISTAAGSSARRVIIDPTVTRFGPDIFDIPIEEFIKSRIRQSDASIDVDGTAIEDLLIKPMALILGPIRREIQSLAIQQTIEDPSLLTDDEADALIANIFASRVAGSRSQGTGRVFFNAPQSFRIDGDAILSTIGGVVFHPAAGQEIDVITMQNNIENSLFFFDIQVIADVEGEEGNIEPGELTIAEDISTIVKVTNLRKFTGGTDRQTNTQLKDFAEQNITERSLTTIRGINSQLIKQFAVEDIQVVGFGDPEMDRDIIEDIGAVLGSGTATISGNLTLTDGSATFTVAPIVRVGDVVTIFSGADTGKTFDITTVTDGTNIDLAGSPVNGSNIKYFVSHKPATTLTISTIPGGILDVFPSIVPNNQVHVGNHTDVYVKVPVFSQDSVDILNLPDPANDKDLGDSTLIDVDLIEYLKATGEDGDVSIGSDTLETEIDLRRFGMVQNDIIRITDPSTIADDYKITNIVDGPLTVTLTLVKLSDGSPFAPIVTTTEVKFSLLSTLNGITVAQLPLVRVTSIQLLTTDPVDPTNVTPEQGADVPYRDPVDIRSTQFFSANPTTPSIGRLRLFFLNPTTVQVDAGDATGGAGTRIGSLFKIESGGDTLYYRPDPDVGLDNIGTGIRKVVDTGEGAATVRQTETDGEFTDVGDPQKFTRAAAATFSGSIVKDDLLTVKDSAGVHLGNFYVLENNTTDLKVTPGFPLAIPRTGLTFTVVAKEDLTAHRISAKDMSLNKEGALFFMDVNVVSYDHNTTGLAAKTPNNIVTADEADGVFNILADALATVSGHTSFGYIFKQNIHPGFTRDESLTFSVQERLTLSFTQGFMQQSRTDPIEDDGRPFTDITAIGATDNNLTGLESRNVRVNFENAPVVQSIQDFVNRGVIRDDQRGFISSGEGRVITENILIKHMIPSFVDLDILYSDGLDASTVEGLVEDLIDQTGAATNLSVSDIDLTIRQNASATDVTMPLGLVSVTHNQDRTVTVNRSQDFLFVTRLLHFFPGRLDVVQQ